MIANRNRDPVPEGTESTAAYSIASSQPPRPTHVRWHVMTLLLVVTALTFLDRLNLGIAGKFIVEEFHIGTETMGWILSAFVFGYALFQVPGGWLGDRFGPRWAITAAILWWSIFSAATAIAPRLPIARWFGLPWSFALLRFLIGVGEAAAFPNANKTVAAWMGTARRGIGNSIFLAGIGVGGAVAPLFIAWLMKNWGWRLSFYVCGGMGLIIAALWHGYVTDDPGDHDGVNAAELAEIRQSAAASGRTLASGGNASFRWTKLLASKSVVGLILSNFFVGYASYLYYTWFYLYLVQVRHLSVLEGGVWGSVPFLAIAIFTPLGGWVSDAAVQRFGRRRGRQSAVWVGLLLASSLVWSGSHAANTLAAILLLGVAAGFLGFATAGWWATAIDLAPHHSGTLSGLMNMGGNLGGWISPVLTAYIASNFGWTRALEFAGCLPLIAAALWLLVRADEGLEAAGIAAVEG